MKSTARRLRRARYRIRVFAALLCLSCLACGSAKTASGGYFSSLEYQARETLSQSLFCEDLSLLSNEEIDRILSSKIELPRDARLALLQIGADPHVLVLPAPEAEGEGDALAAVLERLAASDRLSSVALLPFLLVPRNLSVAKLREAAARFQADLFFIYRTPCQQFQRNRFLAPTRPRRTAWPRGCSTFAPASSPSPPWPPRPSAPCRSPTISPPTRLSVAPNRSP